MKFHQFPPPGHLTSVIRCFWTLDGGSDAASPRMFNTVADGFPGLMLLLPGGAVLNDSEHGEMPPAFIYGQATTCRTLSSQGDLRALGIFFQPHALRTVFGLNAIQLTDACLDLALTGGGTGRTVCEALASASAVERCVQLLCEHIAGQVEAHAALQDPAIINAAAAILAANGDVPIQDVRGAAGLSERTFERRFKQSVGLTPRLFARIRRFQNTLHLMRKGDYTKLSDIAYAGDYADQSHYIRSFREFTGISPLEFRRDATEVVENLVELPRN